MHPLWQLVVHFCVRNCTSHQMVMQQWHAATTTRHSYTLAYQFLTDLQTFDQAQSCFEILSSDFQLLMLLASYQSSDNNCVCHEVGVATQTFSGTLREPVAEPPFLISRHTTALVVMTSCCHVVMLQHYIRQHLQKCIITYKDVTNSRYWVTISAVGPICHSDACVPETTNA